MQELNSEAIDQVSGGNPNEQNVGYVVGYAIGSIISGIRYTYGGGAGRRLGIAVYNVLHKSY